MLTQQTAQPLTSQTPAAVTAPGRGGIHLTRRGRLVLFGVPVLSLLAAAVVALGLLLGTALNQAQASSQEAPGVTAELVTVSHGDTLWGLASSLDSGEDTQVLIQQIAELNDLQGSEIHPGQQLYLPAGH